MLSFPTEAHKEVFEKTVQFLKQKPEIGAVSLGGSLARGKGSPESDVDINAYLNPDAGESVREKLFNDFRIFHHSLMQEGFEGIGKYFHVGFDIRSLAITPTARSWTSGPDEFEVEIGNAYIYCRLVYEHNNIFSTTKAHYIPYYDEQLRSKRLKEVLMYCHNNIGHVEPAIKRGLYFHAFKRLHDANSEFLQALFIAHRIYPIAYDKWIKEQLVEILQLSELYSEFVHLYELNKLESDELVVKSKALVSLIDKYIVT